MRNIKLTFLLALFILVFTKITAQEFQEGVSYSIASISQTGEKVNIISEILPQGSLEVSDTSFTTYQGSSLELKTYFVNGDEYDNIFNPNPTGVVLNNQYFKYYCNVEKSIPQHFNMALEMYEFSFLSHTYIMLINFNENCQGESCRYRCYNLFDITRPTRIRQVSFSSLFQGTDTFSDFNSDGVMDFVRVAPKANKDVEQGGFIDHYLVTAYMVKGSRATQLLNDKQQSYYLYTKGDELVENFEVIQADWFFSVKDTSGNVAVATSYFAPYISFDPLYKYLYNPDGVRIEKNRWSIHVTDLDDLEAAQEECRRIQTKNFDEVFIMIDQYNNDITFQVFVGNFISKDLAMQYQNKLKEIGFDGALRDLRNDY